jgi:xanthine dehydrogenase accessory factor
MMVDDLDLLRQALTWIYAGQRVVLATVVTTWGSAPRPVGSHLIIREDGLFEGSVSGGCVEGAVVVAAQEALQEKRARLLDYGVSNENAWEVGLACGGRIQILLQPLVPDVVDPEFLEQLIAKVTAGARVGVLSACDQGTMHFVDVRQQPHIKEGMFLRIYAPSPRLMLVGAVHIAQAMIPLAQSLGYQVLVVDPRQAFANAVRFPTISVCVEWPDEALARWRVDSASAVVTLTHDPKLDDVALGEALKSPAFYIAALGSSKTHAARLERLARLGFTSQDLARIHGPAGLAIGARTPGEIAIAILAQMTAVQRGVVS